jgi:hypothetical protein
MSTFNAQIAASGDDGRNYTGTAGFSATGTIACVGHSINAVRLACSLFLRFDNVTIPNAATINLATLELLASSNAYGSPELVIHGVNEDDAVAPTTAGEYAADPRVASSVPWDTAWEADAWEQSADIKTIIQDIVSRGGWVSGNALMLQVVDDLGSGTNAVYVKMFETDPAEAAKLYVEYDVGAGPSVEVLRRRR